MSSDQYPEIKDPESFFLEMHVVLETPAAIEVVKSLAQALDTLRSWADSVLRMEATDPTTGVSKAVAATGAALIGFIYNRKAL